MNFDINEFLNQYQNFNTTEKYIFSLVTTTVSFIFLLLFRFAVIKNLKRVINKTRSSWDDLFLNTTKLLNWPFLLVISTNLGLQFLDIGPRWRNYFNNFTLLVISYYFLHVVIRIIDLAGEEFVAKTKQDGDEASTKSMVNLVKTIIKSIIWLVVILVILDRLGINISAIIAGVGVSSIAIAFALQNILEDLFASASIYFERPFKAGDFINVGGDTGTVKKVGFKTTRIKTLDGDELVISNTDISKSRIRNYKLMTDRRVAFTIGVTYDTPTKKLRKIPSIIRKIIESHDKTEVGRIHLRGFGPSSLDFEIVYTVTDRSYELYMDIQEAVNLEIIEKFEKEKIEFAYPTQTVVMKK